MIVFFVEVFDLTFPDPALQLLFGGVELVLRVVRFLVMGGWSCLAHGVDRLWKCPEAEGALV